MMILGIDAGNSNVKVAGPYGVDRFISEIGEYRERNLNDKFSKDDMVFEYKGRMGFAGTLAKYESEFVGSIMGDSKAHEDALIRVLLALHRYSKQECEFQIVVGQPISKHNPVEKQKIKSMLEGEHCFTLNNETKRIRITHANVAAEGGSAFWSSPRKGIWRIIDVGGGTVNFATINDGRYVDKDSGTLTLGMETNKTLDPEALSRGIATQLLKKWSNDDRVLLVGGAADQLFQPIKRYFNSAEVLRPDFYTDQGIIKELSSIFSNAVAFYNIGKKIYG